MAFKQNMTITDAGLDLLGRIHTGDHFHITRAVMGEGTLADKLPGELTGVIAPIVSVSAMRVSQPADGRVTVRFDSSKPEDIPRDFDWSEFGVYVMDIEAGNEILYAYNYDADPQLVQAGGATMKSINVTILIGAASEVTVEIDQSAMYVSTAEHDEHVGDRDNPHKVTAAQAGAATANHGNHVPNTGAADNKKFLRNDNSWQDVTPGNIGAAALSHGLHVPAAQTASDAVYLRNDNTWQTITAAKIGAATAAQGTLATNAVPNTRTVNGKQLNANISLNAADVGAAANVHTHTTVQVGIRYSGTQGWVPGLGDMDDGEIYFVRK